MRRPNKGQIVAEYFILLAVILMALFVTGFIDNIRNAFDNYFNRATDTITVIR